MKTKRIYPVKRQLIDERDYQLMSILNVHATVKLPKMIDLRNLCPHVFDQGQLGSCTANAGVAAREMLNKLPVTLSRLFQYYNERLIENDITKDGGAQMRDIGNAITTYGICLESTCPYDITKFENKPSPQAYTEALAYKIISYYSVPDLNGIKQVLALKQQPVLIGIDVYSSFESATVAKTGIVPLPKKSESMLGGHAICAVGYDDTKKWLICRNSWGETWGDKGYFYLPYTYVSKKYAYDFWCLQN